MPDLRVMLVFLAFGLSGCADQYAGSLSNHFTATAAGANADPSPSSTPSALPDYLLSPGDLLDISVFEVPSLTQEVQIGESGLISLPLIGDIQATGMTTHALQAEITKRLRAKYLQSPQVGVFLKSSAGQRVTVSGAVQKPGVYQIQGRMTLVQAIAFSGGLNDVGDPDSVIVFRKVNGGQMAARFDLSAVQAGRAPDPNLNPGDMVVVDTSGTRSVWSNFKSTLPVVGMFAWVAPYM